MKMNKLFPQWITANIMIKHMASKFGAYVVRDVENVGAIQITFIPEEMLIMVPEEDRELFQTIYHAFAQWAFEELSLSSTLEKYFGEIISDENLYSLKDDINIAIYEFGVRNNIEMKEIFTACFGVGALLAIPKNLKAQLKGLYDSLS